MPHRIIAVVFLLIFNLFSSASADTPKEQISKPLLICYERDPWLMVIGSDSPVFALYENGEVMYRSGEQDPTKRFLNARLSPESTKQFLSTLDLSNRLIEFDRKMIQASTVSDQPTSEILYWVNGEFHAVGIYGQLGGSGSARKDVSDSVLRIWDTVTAFKAPEAKPWLPPYIEVMIWPYEYSPEEPKA